MTFQRWAGVVLMGLALAGTVNYLNQAADEGVDLSDTVRRQTEGRETVSASPGLAQSGRGTTIVERPLSEGGSGLASSYRAASSSLPSLPVGSQVIEVEQEDGNGLRETVVKLETGLAPIELSTFYTDELVDDWIIYRDTLTEGMGWNGVFLQYGEVERRLGVFTVVKSRGGSETEGVVTTVSMMLLETRQ